MRWLQSKVEAVVEAVVVEAAESDSEPTGRVSEPDRRAVEEDTRPSLVIDLTLF